MATLFERRRELRRCHLEHIGNDTITDPEGDRIRYKVYECKYCDDSVRMSQRRFTKAPFEDYDEWGEQAEIHLREEHGIDIEEEIEKKKRNRNSY